MPLARPDTPRPEAFTRTYNARYPDQGQSTSLNAKRRSRCVAKRSLLGCHLGGASSHPVRPMPLTMVALNMKGMAPWYSSCLQCGHMYGQLVKSMEPGTRLARGV